ncbi:hypothetical protein [Weissella viridescens]|uniref:hypothetical protein n=1 Tax=Weissella viridescens TaxID=1629 RepID=UPI003AF23212
MNELRTAEFYTNELAEYPDVAAELKKHEKNMDQIIEDSALNLGKELYEARQLLKQSNIEQSFNAWADHVDLSPATAYNMANYYEATLYLNDSEKEVYGQLPKKLAYKLSKTLKLDEVERDDATNEALKSVFDGDIKTLPEYKDAIEEINSANQMALDEKDKELLAERQQREEIEQDLITVQDDYNELRSVVDEQREKIAAAKPETQVIEKIPEDYEQLKADHDRTMNELNNLKRLNEEQADTLQKKESELRELEIRLEEVPENAENYEAIKLEFDRQAEELRKIRMEKQELENLSNNLVSTSELVEVQFMNLLGNLETSSSESRITMNPALLDLREKLTKILSALDNQLAVE